jgi:hypothetical protein
MLCSDALICREDDLCECRPFPEGVRVACLRTDRNSQTWQVERNAQTGISSLAVAHARWPLCRINSRSMASELTYTMDFGVFIAGRARGSKHKRMATVAQFWGDKILTPFHIVNTAAN